MRTTVAVVLVICVGSCELGSGHGGDRAVSWEGSTRDSAGVTIVENYGAPVWEGLAPWTFTQVSDIGLSTVDPQYQFGVISAAAWLSDGSIAVADGLAQNIRIFSVDGSLLTSIGHEGAGPGEFRGLADLLVGPGDTLLAIDWGNLRAGRITRDGTWHGSFSLAPLDGFFQGYWADDQATGHIVTYLGPMFGRAEPEDSRFAFVVLRDMQGGVLDTIARADNPESATRGSAGQALQHYYRGRAEFALCNGTAIVGDQDDYVLEWRGIDGTLMRVVSLERDPMPMTEEDHAVLFDVMDRVARERGQSSEQAARRKDNLRFEEQYPEWRDVVCGPAGTVLVQRTRPLREFSEEELVRRGRLLLDPPDAPGGDWEVFDSTGRYLGVAPFPADPGRRSFRRDADGSWLMMAATADDIGTPFVTVWRLEGVEPE